MDELKNTVRKVGRRLNYTEAMVKSAVIEHCHANKILKEEDRMIMSADFSSSKTRQARLEFEKKFKEFRQSRKRVDRDKL